MNKEEYFLIRQGINNVSSGCEVVKWIFDAMEEEDIQIEVFSDKIRYFGDLLISEGEFFKSVAEKKSQSKD